MEAIELREYIYMIRRKLWLVALITFLSVAISGLVSIYILEPEYETFTTLMLSKPNTGTGVNEAIQYNDLLLNQKLVATYEQIAKSRLISNEVIKNLGLDLTPEQLGMKVNVSLIKDTEIIKIVANDKNPVLATNIANETAEVFKNNIANIMKIENVQVIDKAEVPKSPAKPKPMLNMSIAGVLGIMISLLLVFILEYMDNTIKTPSDIEKYLDIPVIGMMPKSLEPSIHNNPKTPTAEAYRILRTNIQFTNIDNDIKSIVVTSSGPSEGKSTVVSNLAIAMAQVDKKVLLVDADLRKPRIHKIFDLLNFSGLTTVLSENLDYKAIKMSTEIGGLDILTSGPIPPNPAELLGSLRMKEFLEKAKEDYDVVLLDTPPVGIVTDAAVLATKCHGVILVCAVNQTIIRVFIKGKELLQKVNANTLGIVMNKIPLKKSGYYKHHFYNYYKSYYEES